MEVVKICRPPQAGGGDPRTCELCFLAFLTFACAAQMHVYNLAEVSMCVGAHTWQLGPVNY